MAMPPRDNLGAEKLCFESRGSFFVGGFGESRVYGEDWVEKGRFLFLGAEEKDEEGSEHNSERNENTGFLF